MCKAHVGLCDLNDCGAQIMSSVDGFSWQGYLSGVSTQVFRRIFPNPGIEPRLLNWQADFFFFLPLSNKALCTPISVLKIQIRNRLKKMVSDFRYGGGFSYNLGGSFLRRFWPS